jgi:Peptidase family M1 domain
LSALGKVERMRTILAGLAAMFVALIFIAGPSLAGPKLDAGQRLDVEQAVRQSIEAMAAEAVHSQSRFRKQAEFMQRKSKAVNPIDVIQTEIAFDADEAAGTIDTEITIVVKATEDGVDSVELSVMKMDTFSIEDDIGTSLTFDYNDYYRIATVALPATLDKNQTQELVFKNSGDPGCDPDDFFGMQFCQVSSEIVFFAGMDWVPAKAAYTYEDVYGQGTVNMDITTPPDYVAATTSDLDSVDDLGTELVHHFVGHFNDTHGGMAYAKFDTFTTDTPGGKPVTAYIHEGTTDYGDLWSAVGADIVDYFSTIYTDYIYNKQDMIQAVEELGGGVGPQSATFYYASAFNTDPQAWSSESIFSHEIGHAWWGNMIRMGDSHSPWINEGFAEYSARRYGYQIWDSYMQDYLYEIYFRVFTQFVDPSDDVPITSSGILSADSMTYQAITYWKGSAILRMLEWVLGDGDFLKGMSAYAEKYRSDHSDDLTTPVRFQDTMEAETGADLDTFFDNWVYAAGYPVYEWAAQFDEQDDGSWTVRVKAEQVQDSEVVYEIPLEVSIWVGDEEDPRSYRLEFEGTTADATWEFDAEPRGTQVDRASWIWGEKFALLLGDVDGSNDVDGFDLIYAAWCQGGRSFDNDHYNYMPEADFDHDGEINKSDLNLLYANFGRKGTIDE